MPSDIPERVIIFGSVGPETYGLGEGANEKLRQIGSYAAGTQDLHGAWVPADQRKTTVPSTDWYEIATWCRLAAQGECQFLELMWPPMKWIESVSDIGRELIEIRSAFLSANAVKTTYMQYAVFRFHQILGLEQDTSAEGRATKAEYGRDLLRLLWQGHRLYAAGRLDLEVDEPGRFYAFGERMASNSMSALKSVMAEYEFKFGAAKTALPSSPDKETINRFMRFVRLRYLNNAN